MTKNQLKALFSGVVPVFASANTNPAQQVALNRIQRIIDATAVELPGVPSQAAPTTYRIYVSGDLNSVINLIFNSGPGTYLLTWPTPARRLCGAILAKAYRPALGSPLGYGNAADPI